MSRFRTPGGYRRTVKSGSMGDTRKFRSTLQRRAQQAEACQFPSLCECVDCKPVDDPEPVADDGVRCMDCGGEGEGGSMDPDEWFECGTCKGTGTR
jgi:hypothetical protein